MALTFLINTLAVVAIIMIIIGFFARLMEMRFGATICGLIAAAAVIGGFLIIHNSPNDATSYSIVGFAALAFATFWLIFI